MDIPTIGFHPEGEDGLWVFRISMPGIGQISRGEVKVQTKLAEEDLPAEVQKAMALEKVHLLAEMLLKASEAP